jgi:NADH pyrophosphatase NudC (nudix superfamily)
MAKYVAVPAEQIQSVLTKAGFEPSIQGKELVYSRKHHKVATLVVKVYTSITAQRNQKGEIVLVEEDQTVRRRGGDAIRTCLVWEGEYHGQPASAGMAKATRTFRAGSVASVLDRMIKRMREVYAQANEQAKAINAGKVCAHCGAPVYLDSGACVVWKCRKSHHEVAA